MNNWLYLLQWVIALATVRMSYDLTVPATKANRGRTVPFAKKSQHRASRSDRLKRFRNLPPATQEKVLAYGENLLKYLEAEAPKNTRNSS